MAGHAAQLVAKSHPYRTQALMQLCTVASCDHRAQFRCPRCRRPFCIQHLDRAGCCSDCDLAAVKTTARVCTAVVIGYSLVSCSGILALANASPLAGVVAGSLAVLGGLIAFRLAEVAVRRKMLGTQGWLVEEDAVIELAKSTGQDTAVPVRRHLGRWSHGGDVYSAARRAGFRNICLG